MISYLIIIICFFSNYHSFLILDRESISSTLKTILSKKQAGISSLWKIRLCFDCVKATNSIPDSFVAGQKLISWNDPSVNRCDIQSLVSFLNINRIVGGYNVHFMKIVRMWATSGNRIFCTKMVYHIYLNDFVPKET